MTLWSYFNVKLDDLDEDEVERVLKILSNKRDPRLKKTDDVFLVEFIGWCSSIDYARAFGEEYDGELPVGTEVALSGANDRDDNGYVKLYVLSETGWDEVIVNAESKSDMGENIAEKIKSERGWYPRVHKPSIVFN